MVISYKKLWILLLERDLNKGDLRAMTGLSSSSIAKLTKGENVNTDILIKICAALNCSLSDIMELAPDKNAAPSVEEGKTGENL